MSLPVTLTRRSLVGGVFAVGLATPGVYAQSGTPVATPAGYTWPEPIRLDNRLEVRDWRLSIDEAPSRFLVEIHNTSDAAVPAPTVGIILPHLDRANNYGWADPFTPVIHPGQSTFLVGLTPASATEQSDLDAAEWIWCHSDVDSNAILAKLDNLEYEVESEYVVHRADWMECSMTVRNLGTKPIWSMRLAGIVRDADGRICGGTAFSTLNNIEEGESLDMVVHVRPGIEMNASPFAFARDLTGGSASFSLQPRGRAVNPGCPAVMPWNR